MKMGIYQATYGSYYSHTILRKFSDCIMIGVGALVAPLVSTQFAAMEKWSYFFLISLGISLSTAVALFSAFGVERVERKSSLSSFPTI